MLVDVTEGHFDEPSESNDGYCFRYYLFPKCLRASLQKNEALLGTIGIDYPILWPIRHHHIDRNKSLSVHRPKKDTAYLDTATLTKEETAKLLGILRGLDHYLAGKEVMPNSSD